MADKISDLSIEELSDHLEKWAKDREAQFVSGNLNDHEYLKGVLRDCTQDINELLHITRGILNRLKAEPKSTEKTNG